MKIRSDKPSAVRSGNGRVVVARGSSASAFTKEIKRQEGKLLEDDRQLLEGLRNHLFEAGEQLEKDPTLANFSSFCELIGKFARKATAMAYRIETITGGAGARPLDIVSIIDKETDELYHLVMQGQRCRIQIAAKILSIKGLIVKMIA